MTNELPRATRRLNLRAVRDVNTGFGDGLATAFEIVATPLICGFFGFLLDRWVGTHLVFALTFGLTTFGYMMWKLVVRYNSEMDAHAVDAPWSRQPPTDRTGGSDG